MNAGLSVPPFTVNALAGAWLSGRDLLGCHHWRETQWRYVREGRARYPVGLPCSLPRSEDLRDVSVA